MNILHYNYLIISKKNKNYNLKLLNLSIQVLHYIIGIIKNVTVKDQN